MRKKILFCAVLLACQLQGGSNEVDLLDVPDMLRNMAELAQVSLKEASSSGITYDTASMAYFANIEKLSEIFTGNALSTADIEPETQNLIDVNSQLKTSIEVQESIQNPPPAPQEPELNPEPDFWAQEKIKIAGLVNIVDVPDNPGHGTDAARTQNMQGKMITVPDEFNPRDYMQGGGDGACQFLSSLASIMSLSKGREAIQKLIVAQDETHVYFKFHQFLNPQGQEIALNDALGRVYKVPRKFISAYGSYPSQSPDWLHLLMRAYYFLITSHKQLDVMAPNEVLQVNRQDKFTEVWSQVPGGQNAFSPLVGKRVASLSYVEWARRKAEAAFSDLKDKFTGAAQNMMGFFRHGHALSMIKTDQGVAAYDNLTGKPDEVIPENLDNQTFMDRVFTKIRAWGGSVLSYFTEPL